MSTTKRSREDLQGILEHLGYETAMLQHAAEYLETQEPGTSRYFAHLESFCVHARNLMHFLYPEKAKDNDVLAQDFFEDREFWKRSRPKQPKLLKDARDRMNIKVAHLSYHRLRKSGEEKKWLFGEICGKIERILAAFKCLLPKSLLATHLVSTPKESPLLAAYMYGRKSVPVPEMDTPPVISSMAGMTTSMSLYMVRGLPDDTGSEDDR